MREGGKPDLKSIFAKAGEIVGAKVREGSGALPVATVDGQESSKPVVPAVEAKAGAAPVSSSEPFYRKGTETAEQYDLRKFVESIPDKERICLTNKEGTARNYYTRSGSKLLKGRDGKDATEEASKKYNNGWRIAPPENSVPAKDLIQQAGEPVSAPVGTSNDQAEKLVKPEISTVEFDEFLKRPEGSEKIEMIKSLITTEWDDFYQRIFEQAREKNGFVSYGERARLWNAFFLPQLKEAVTEYLDRHESVHKRDGGRIFRTILRKLEEEFIKNKE